jgi:hypothetical protein
VTYTPPGEGERAANPGKRELAAAVSGIRQPIVIVLLLIAFFSAIAGKPLDGLLMLLVALGLGWDARHRSAQAATVAEAAALAEGAPVPEGGALAAGEAAAEDARSLALPAREGLGRTSGIALLVAGVLYAAVVGSFSRYSWPATIAVVGVGAAVVIIGWHGPVRRCGDPGPLPRVGTGLWGGVLLAGSLWELASLARQPSLDVTSWAHPTISALTDPVLAGHPGRTLVLGLWLLIGYYLVRR